MMIKLDWDKNFNLQISCQLQLPVEAGDKLEILSEFSKLYNEFEKFGNWMDNSEVPQTDKYPFNMHLVNARIGLNYIYKFLQNCGITDLEIREFAQIPF
jgi:hypothetical protein